MSNKKKGVQQFWLCQLTFWSLDDCHQRLNILSCITSRGVAVIEGAIWGAQQQQQQQREQVLCNAKYADKVTCLKPVTLTGGTTVWRSPVSCHIYYPYMCPFDCMLKWTQWLILKHEYQWGDSTSALPSVHSHRENSWTRALIECLLAIQVCLCVFSMEAISIWMQHNAAVLEQGMRGDFFC